MCRMAVMMLLLAAMGSTTTSAQEIFASIRPDAWLKEFMVEKQPAPKDGRRVHVVAAFNQTGIGDSDLRSVTINGAECLGLPSDDKADLRVYDWCRAHVGDSHLWISYHTRNSQFAEGRKLAVKATTSRGSLVDAVIEANFSPLVLSHVTTTDAGRKAVIHVHSQSHERVAVSGLQFDGAEVPSTTSHVVIPPNGHALYVVDLLQPKAHGDVWTAVLQTDHPSTAGAGVGWGGRVGPERFPIETWPHSTDCVVPQPNVSNQNATEVRELGIDSVFEGFGRFKDNCDTTRDGTAKTYSRVLDSLAAEGYWHVFLDGEKSDQWDKNAMISPQTRAKVVDAILTGDEVDGGLTAQHLRKSLNLSLENIRHTRDLMTYQGAATNAFIGAFAGITDIQGCDAYAAACAPTQLAAVKTLPLSYPYHYLRNARDNHMPLTFWGYSQLYSPPDSSSAALAGQYGAGAGTGWDYDPQQNELVAQIAQTVLSGSKGLMFFQTFHSVLSTTNTSLVRSAIQSVRAVSETIRVGDIEGLRFNVSSRLNEEVMVETILSPTQLLVVVINIDATGYSNLLCHVDIEKHWNFRKHTLQSLTLDLTGTPQVRGLSNWREVVDGQMKQPNAVRIGSHTTGTVSLERMELDDQLVARFFVADVAFK